MAILTDYNFKGILIKDAYIKITYVGMIDRKEGDVKVFTGTLLFEIKANKEAESIHTDILHYVGNPDVLLYEQAYSELKKAFPESMDI